MPRVTMTVWWWIIILCFSSTAQENTIITLSPEEARVPYFTFGGTSIHVDEINNRICAQGYKKFERYSIIIGGGIHKIKGRSIFDFELRGIRWKKNQYNSNQSSLSSVTGLISYCIMCRPPIKRFNFFPFIGSGFGRIKLELNKTGAPFDTLLQKSVINLSMTQKVFVIQGGIGSTITFIRSSSHKSPFVIGLHAGYAFDLSNKNDWYEKNMEIYQGPSLSLTGPFLKASIGLSIRKNGKHIDS